MWTLFGKPLQALRGQADDTASYLDDAADSVGGIGDAGGSAADGLGGASKAAKELKKQLTVLPFDELNQLAKNTDTAGSGGGSGGSGGGGGGGVGGIGDLGLNSMLDNINNSELPDAINKWAEKIKKAFHNHDWKGLGITLAEMVNEGLWYLFNLFNWNRYKGKVLGFINAFHTVVNQMMAKIDWDLLGRVLARGLNIITYTLTAWITGFHWIDYGGYLATALNGLLDAWDAEAFGRLLAAKFNSAWHFFLGFVTGFDFRQLGQKLKSAVISAIDNVEWNDVGKAAARFVNGISRTIIEFLGDGAVRDKLAGAFSTTINSFLTELDENDVKSALQAVGDTIFGGLLKAWDGIDKSALGNKIFTILKGLPWGAIGLKLGASIGAKIITGIFTTKVVGNILANVISKSISGALGTGGTTAATTGGTAAATGGSAAALGGAGIMGGLMAFGLWMRKMAENNGGLDQFNGQNMGLSTQTSVADSQSKNQKTLNQAGMNGAGYNTSLQTQQIIASPQVQNATQTIQTILTGIKDPSFINLENAKASLMKNPVVKKLMDGSLSKGFSNAWVKFTDTGAYKAVKKFSADVSKGMTTWWSHFTDVKPRGALKKFSASVTSGLRTWWTNYTTKKDSVYAVVKSFGAKTTPLLRTWWKNYTDQNSYQANKKFGADPTPLMVKWWGRFTDTGAYKAIKEFGADPTPLMKEWWGHLVDTAERSVTKVFKAKDGGNFVNYVDKVKDYVVDKWIDINVSLKKHDFKDLGAMVMGAWKSLISFSWFATGGVFNSASVIGVGEAGAEAVIPLTNQKTMKMIGNAITEAGGMGNGGANSDEIADAIALRVLPAMAQLINGQSDRPVNVNAVLYTENNEVLARAVQRGERTLDKRYNPISQYSYGY